MQPVTGENYQVRYDQDNRTVHFEGNLRLNGMQEYAPIQTLLDQAAEHSGERIEWDLRRLDFLNSSGINLLYKFVVNLRRKGQVSMKVLGNNDIAWQKKSLTNMKKFMPGLELVMD